MGVVIGLVFLVGFGCFIASFFVRRHGENEKPKSDWRRTEEVFNDPSTHRIMRVWLDGAGERHYVPDSSGPAV